MSTMKGKLIKINESKLQVISPDSSIDSLISRSYRFQVPNFHILKKRNPRFKHWNGYIELYDRESSTMDMGHWMSLYETLQRNGHDFALEGNFIPEPKFESREELEDVINDYIQPKDGAGESIVPYDYQVNAINHALESDRSVILSATSSGKSLIIYCLTWIYKELLLKDEDGYIVVIVPDKGLVEQMYSDMLEYSGGEYEGCTQKINSDYAKILNKRVIITTFQSAIKMKNLIEDAKCIIVDEVHRAKAKQLRTIMEEAINCKYKHGLTGTLDGVEANEVLIEGLFGPVARFVTQRELIESGRACEVFVNIIGVKYGPNLVREYEAAWELQKLANPNSSKYQFEVDFINNCDERNDLLLDMVDFVDGNSFVLFNRKEGHGHILHEKCLERASDPDDVYLITGDVKDRKTVIDEFKDKTNAKMFATSSIMSTGVSVKNLHNLFFAFSQKSKVATLQSIGRLMRLHDSKTSATVYDFVDIIGDAGITEKHVEERIGHYNNEQIPFKITILEVEKKPA